MVLSDALVGILALVLIAETAEPDPVSRFVADRPDPNMRQIEKCMSGGDYPDIVVLKLDFDLDGEGRPQNVRLTSSNAPCFEKPLISNFKRWKYAERDIDGNLIGLPLTEQTMTLELQLR